MRFYRWIFVLFALYAFAQEETCILRFQPVFQKEELRADKVYKLNDKDTIVVETLRFYVSQIEFIDHGKVVHREKNSFHLIDIAAPNSLAASIKIPKGIKYNAVSFNLGIDSLTNVSGALDGDLDPTKGMYWTWQSGYINFKLEGKSNLCKTRNHAFEYHIGGYLPPYTALQKIQININPQPETIIYLDLEKYFSDLNLSSENQIMSPGKNACDLSAKAAKCFSTKHE